MALKMDDLFSVKDYVAVVTGGCSGLGLMISKVRTPLLEISAHNRRAWSPAAPKSTSSHTRQSPPMSSAS